MKYTLHWRQAWWVLALSAAGAAQAGRPLAPEDWYRFLPVSDIQVAPDGGSVAYLVTRYDKEADASRADLWTVSWAGGDSRQLTRGEAVSTPRFSPDGRYLSFLSARPADGPQQLWLLDRRGGEPRQVSHVSGEITEYEWLRNGQQVILAVHADDETAAAPAVAAGAAADAAAGKDKPPRPIVIDTLKFKEDVNGYWSASSHTNLWLLDIATEQLAPLTRAQDRNDSEPAVSPDGKQLAYVSHRNVDEGVAGQDEIWQLDLTSPGAAPHRLATVFSPNRQRLRWSADGRQLALLIGEEPKYSAYITDRLAIVDVQSGALRVLTGALDRAVLLADYAADGGKLWVSVEDDGYQYPATVDVVSGQVTPTIRQVVAHELAGGGGQWAALVSNDHAPPEVYAVEHGALRALTTHNAPLFSELALGGVEELSFKSRDGTEVHGQLVKPPDYVAGRRYPTIVWIHGGPNGQDDHSLELWGYGPPLERQWFATHGYVVLAINYRGSTGRGTAFARSIYADWGHHEVEDLRAGVDALIARGIADPKRLGIGGWSYGGILTDYTIAIDTRFRAAISGAGSANQAAMYGVDQYVMQYNAELGAPWRNPALWNKVSYPFLHADRIRTPTLFMGGDKDFNVPLAGGEQMYQALRTLGVPAQLVIYPGEYHVLTRPSFIVDRWQRFLSWMDTHLAPEKR